MYIHKYIYIVYTLYYYYYYLKKYMTYVTALKTKEKTLSDNVTGICHGKLLLAAHPPVW